MRPRLLMSFVYRRITPPKLHSFPTRRSSDLLGVVIALIRTLYKLGQGPKCFSFGFYGGLVKRSEEHTSELQSLRQLVCRLLLEKKNAGQHAAAERAERRDRTRRRHHVERDPG